MVAGVISLRTKSIYITFRYEYTVEIDFQSRIIQLLPDENLIGEGETSSKTPQGSPVKTTKKVGYMSMCTSVQSIHEYVCVSVYNQYMCKVYVPVYTRYTCVSEYTHTTCLGQGEFA